MPYKITIEEIKTETVTEKGEWRIVDRVPWSDEDVKKFAFQKDLGSPHAMEKEPLKEVYGYSPERQVNRTNSVKVLEQTVAELDLIPVIKAINGIQT